MTLTVTQMATPAPRILTPDNVGALVAYINEHPQGREVTIAHTPPGGGAAVTPSGSLDSGPITAGPWRVTAAGVDVRALDSDLQAAVMSATVDTLRLRLS